MHTPESEVATGFRSAIVLFSPIPRPQRILVALSLWSIRSALWADALELVLAD